MNMKKEEFLKLMDETLGLEPGTLAGPEALRDFGAWDSLAVVSFMALADKHYHVTLPPRQIMACTTVADLLNLAGPPNQVSAGVR
jgi:acyl carrier protein